MDRGWWGRFAVLAVCTLGAGFIVTPTALNLDSATTKFPFKEKMNLGLDLQGGLSMVLGVDFQKLYREIIERQSAELSERLKSKGLSPKSIAVPTEGVPAEDPRILVKFEPQQAGAIKDVVAREFTTLRKIEDQSEHMVLGISFDYLSQLKTRTIEQSIEVIRNRVDEFGVSEPSINSQGTDRLVVELPGVRDVARAKDLIGKTARLEYRLVDDSVNPAALMGWISEAEKQAGIKYQAGDQNSGRLSEYVHQLNEKLKGKLPADTELAFGRTDLGGLEPYVLKSKAEVTGDDLQDAHVAIDPQSRQPQVAFRLNPRGAVVFSEVTRANIKRRLAIVLDSVVHSAPTIQSEIPEGRGQITLGTGDPEKIMREANDLAIVLRAGALPAQLNFMEERVVGPTLGQDSIKKGSYASILGALLVFVLIMIYYRVSGVIAAISLALNVLFVNAILVAMEATLTLPGIAGIGLTVGIAVDSNVVIYERIREELRLGKRPRAAVEAGFQKAFSTILDANVTNAVAAIILLTFGTGPIKGFAVTMLIGIITTLFTAVFVCRVLFDLYLTRLDRRGSQTLSV